MITKDLTHWLTLLTSVTDHDLHRELEQLISDINIDDDKFTQAFSACACAEAIAHLDLITLRSLLNTPTDISDSDMDRNRWRACFIFRGYTAFVYMRSKTLESGLDAVAENSPIRPFRDFFRSGNQKKGDDTVAQHIRNSLSHGSFTILRDFREVKFIDGKWDETIDAGLFYNGLCGQVERFYQKAFEAQRRRGAS